MHPPRPKSESQPWPFPGETRVTRERLERLGVRPDPSWRYDRATDTYRPPVLRDHR